MCTMTAAAWMRRTPRARLLSWFGWLGVVAPAVFCWEQMTRDTIWAFVADVPTQASGIGGRMVPPRGSCLSVLWKPLWDMLNMATLGTALGVLMAVPIAFLAARNATPSALLMRPLALFVIVASRSLNALIRALLLVAILGPGLLPGIIAIALRSLGFVVKLLYEAIEEIDRHPVEAIVVTGHPGRARWPTRSCRRSCRPSRASACSAGTSTSVSRRYWGWSVPAASDFSSRRR